MPVSGSQAVYLTGYTSTPESKVYPRSLGSTGTGKEQVLGIAGEAMKELEQKSHTTSTQTVTSKSNAPAAAGRAGFDEKVTAMPQSRRPETDVFANHVSGSGVSSRGGQESVSPKMEKQASDAENALPSYIPHIQTIILKGSNMSTDQLASVKKQPQKKYARKLLKHSLIPGYDSEDVTLTGYKSLSEEISSSSNASSANKEETQVLSTSEMHSVPQQRNRQRSDTSNAKTIMLKNDVDIMLPNENDDPATTPPPFEGRPLTKKELPAIRRAGIKLIDRVLSMQTPSSAIRKLEFEDVRIGGATINDISRSCLHIYGVNEDNLCMSSVDFLMGIGNASQAPATVHKSSLEQHPSDELCNLLQMTKEEYQSNLNTSGHRAIAATVLKELIRSAASKQGKSVTDIHPVLIEELITTTNQGCICGFPSFEVESSNHNLFITQPPEKMHITTKPVYMGIDRGLYIDFKSENELSMYSHFYPVAWLGGYVATHLWYDVSVSPDTGQLHYKNFVVRIAFPGVDKVYPEPKFRSKIDMDSISKEEVTIFRNLPRKMPASGFVLEWNLPDESIPIADMFSVRPAKTTPIRDSVAISRKRLSKASESEVSTEGQEEGASEFSSISAFIKSAFMRLCELVKNSVLSICDLLFSCFRPSSSRADEKESCSTERDTVEAASISVDDRKQDIYLGAESELPKEQAQPLSVDDDTSERASREKDTCEEEARNAASTYLGEGAAVRAAAEPLLHTQAKRRRGTSVAERYVSSTLCRPDSYLSDSSADELSRRHSRTL